jgi:hypothetical protein
VLTGEFRSTILLPVSSRLGAEGRWFLVNYVLLNALGFVLGLGQGAMLLASASACDGSIPGWTGSPVEQLFWYAVAVVFYVPLILGIPLLAIALIPWRIAIRIAGHPRLAAYVEAAVIILAAAILTPRTAELSVWLWVAIPLFAYAAIVRRPPPMAGDIRGHQATSASRDPEPIPDTRLRVSIH